MRRKLTSALLGLAISGAACTPREPAMEPILRFIDEPAPPVFDVSELLGEQVVRSWSFAEPPPGPWRLREIASARSDGVGWWLVPEQRRAMLVLDDAALVAGEVDVIAVEVEGRSLGGAHLHWGPAGEPMTAQRQLHAPFSGQTRQTFLFRVGRHPQWRGEIGRLQLTLWTAPGMQVGLSSMRALKQRLDERKLELATESPWRVDLPPSGFDDTALPWRERRLALLGWPGRTIERVVDVPKGAELRLAFGVLAPASEAPSEVPLSEVPPSEVPGTEEVPGIEVPESTGAPPGLRFRVLAESEGRQHVLADERWSAAAGGPVWRPLRLDLSQWDGSRLSLRLLVEGPERLDPRRQVPFWAHPEVVAPALGEPPPSVVLIVADTLRADRLSLYGHHHPSSPHLDAWAEQHGAVFESVTSSAGWTLPSHVSIFTGLDAPGHGVNWPSSRVGDSLTTIAERLYAAGYQTEAITGGGYLDATYGLDQGFQRYRAALRGHEPHELEPPRTLDAALEALSRLEGRPFLLFVHSYAVHAPYVPWQPFFSRVSEYDPLAEVVLKPPAPGDFRARHQPRVVSRGAEAAAAKQLVEDQYDSGVHRLDGLLRPLLEQLAGREDLLVVFTSDHGEMLGEGGHFDHGHVFDAALKVPLVIQSPHGLGAGARIERPSRSVDLLPTVLELLGQASPPGLDGRSLAPLLRGEPGEGPVFAWSYGRRVDEGLTLRLRDRLKLLLHDDLLFGGSRRARAFEVASSPRLEREIAMPEQLRPFVAEAREKLLDELPGLHVVFSNLAPSGSLEGAGGPSPTLRFELQSGAAVPERIKVPDLPCDCVTWRPPVGLDVEVPPGVSFTVVLGDVRDARLQMILERSDGTRQRLRLDLTEHDRPLAMAVEDERFEVSAGPPPEVGIGVRWNGPRGILDHAIDAETLQSLRALGYLR